MGKRSPSGLFLRLQQQTQKVEPLSKCMAVNCRFIDSQHLGPVQMLSATHRDRRWSERFSDLYSNRVQQLCPRVPRIWFINWIHAS
jgi:hypothetical protein